MEERRMPQQTRKIVLVFAVVLYSVTAVYMVLTLDQWVFSRADAWGIFLLLLLMLIVSNFPLHMKGTYIIFTSAISMAVFLVFGLGVEIILTQLAMLFALIRIKKKTWESYVANLSMFLLTSIGAALTFWALGGEVRPFGGDFTELQLIPIFGYISAFFLINRIIIYYMQNKLYGMNRSFLGKDFWWDLLPLLYNLPLGIFIYVLYSYFQAAAVFYVMLPIVAFSFIIRLYNKLDVFNEKLQAINQTGTAMTAHLKMEDVLGEFTMSIEKLVSFQYLYLYKVDSQQQILLPLTIRGSSLSDQERQAFMSVPVNMGDGLSGQVALHGETKQVIHEQDDLHFDYEPDFLHHQNSILSVPLLRNEQVFGVLTVSHKKTNHFTKEDRTIIEILASQAAIALKNAEDYEMTKRKSERDELTGLYNYRFFEQLIEQKIVHTYGKPDPFSLDIDHFKTVNDQYGHYAGNRILQQMATLLQQHVPESSYVARYGGEEFTIILQDTDCEAAYEVAEQLRKKIEKTPMFVEDDLKQQDGKQEQRLFGKNIFITVSIGLSTYPTHADDSLSLIRHADRAMYTGAKRSGRNKVAVYEAG